MGEAIGSICFVILVAMAIDKLDDLAILFQSMWGGRVRELKAENKALKDELKKYREGEA